MRKLVAAVAILGAILLAGSFMASKAKVNANGLGTK
jgi:outer membrane murein-binding lipoprotein Lpp